MTNQLKAHAYDAFPTDVGNAIDSISKLKAPESAVERLIATASHDTNVSATTRQVSSKASVPKLWRWASAMAAAAVILVVLNLTTSTSGNLYANMKKLMEEVNSMQFVSQVVDGDGNELYLIESSFQKPRLIRQEFADGIVVVGDLTHNEMLRIDPVRKTATLSSLEGSELSLDLFDGIMRVVEGDADQAKRVGELEIDGVAAVEYRVLAGSLMARVFIGVESNLPLRIEFPSENGSKVVATQFEFNPPLDLAMFELQVPDGFERIVKDDVDVNLDAKKVVAFSGDPTKLILAPEGTLGGVEFGFTMEQVIEKLGEPDVLGSIESRQTKFLNFNSIGVQIQVEPKVGVTSIGVVSDQPEFNSVAFAGQFEGGIRVGDSSASVTGVLGKPTRKNGFADDSATGSLVFESLHEGCVSVFHFEGNRLVWAAVRPESSE